MRIISLLPACQLLFAASSFDLDLWRALLDDACPGLAALCEADLAADTAAGYLSFERDVLPVVTAACRDKAGRDRVSAIFGQITHDLPQRIRRVFRTCPAADVILYPGLCNGAGWVTRLGTRDVILLGVEKILELHWDAPDAMRGLVYHELGHVYQQQCGVLERPCHSLRQHWLWQLYTEGVAMYFEQLLMGDPHYYHQDQDGWADWCGAHLSGIIADFLTDMDAMQPGNQRYFGDWVSYCGHGDVGYYLGARFLQFICRERPFDAALSLTHAEVEALFMSFADQAPGSAPSSPWTSPVSDERAAGSESTQWND